MRVPQGADITIAGEQVRGSDHMVREEPEREQDRGMASSFMTTLLQDLRSHEKALKDLITSR
jgi:hypothetical protein